MTNGNLPLGFEEAWRQLGEGSWSCSAQSDETIQIVAEGVEMIFVSTPFGIPEICGLVARVGSFQGLPDEGTLGEEALAWNAMHYSQLSLVGEEELQLKAMVLIDGRRGFEAEYLRLAIREMIDTVREWKDKMTGGRE